MGLVLAVHGYGHGTAVSGVATPLATATKARAASTSSSSSSTTTSTTPAAPARSSASNQKLRPLLFVEPSTPLPRTRCTRGKKAAGPSLRHRGLRRPRHPCFGGHDHGERLCHRQHTGGAKLPPIRPPTMCTSSRRASVTTRGIPSTTTVTTALASPTRVGESSNDTDQHKVTPTRCAGHSRPRARGGPPRARPPALMRNTVGQDITAPPDRAAFSWLIARSTAVAEAWAPTTPRVLLGLVLASFRIPRACRAGALDRVRARAISDFASFETARSGTRLGSSLVARRRPRRRCRSPAWRQ